ncbi:MAG: DUF2723 domain-containing protein [Chloroflexi bacterium]|nr:DUF2723 domain-containing protein [Chloroflexota bacterium]
MAGYLPTLAPSITWKNGGIDSGELALAVSAVGIAHPTGYPLYVVLGKVFTWLPWGEPAFRLNLFSALSAALAAAVLAYAVQRACPAEVPPWARDLAAGVAGLLLAFTPALWSQAVITEVYALHSLFVAANLALLLAATDGRRAGRPRAVLALGCLVAGLALAHHVTILLLAPGTGLYLWLARRTLPPLGRREVAVGVGLLLLGLSPYLLLPLRSSQQAVANWGDPQTLANFVAQVSARDYAGMLTGTPTTAALARIPAAARLVLEQYGWAGVLLITTGGWVLWQQHRALAGHLALSGGLVLAQAAHYVARDSEVYLLPLYVLLALALGVGAASALAALPTVVPRRAGRQRRAFLLTPELARLVGGLALAALPVVSYLQHRSAVDVHADGEAVAYAREVLEGLAPQAVVLAADDRETFSLWYVHSVLGVRQDVLVLDARLLAWPWYLDNLRRLYPDLSWPERPRATVAEVVAATRPRPVYFTYADPAFRTVPQGRVFALALDEPTASGLGKTP